MYQIRIMLAVAFVVIVGCVSGCKTPDKEKPEEPVVFQSLVHSQDH